jgi:hypothetical protein
LRIDLDCDGRVNPERSVPREAINSTVDGNLVYTPAAVSKPFHEKNRKVFVGSHHKDVRLGFGGIYQRSHIVSPAY